MLKQSEKIKEIAEKLISIHDRVAHIEINKVLFLINLEEQPKALARCYSFSSHPINFFTDKKFCIVVYDQNTDWMTDKQLAILILHELMHIPLIGNKLIDHNVKEFSQILDIDLNWCKKGQEVPDILK